MLVSPTFRCLTILFLAIAPLLRTGAISAVEAADLSAKNGAGSPPEETEAEFFGEGFANRPASVVVTP